MADFSIQDTAFTGFGVVRQHPRALLAWWLFALVFSAGLSAGFVGLAGPDLANLMVLNAQRPSDPNQILDEILAMSRLRRLCCYLACRGPSSVDVTNAILSRGDGARAVAGEPLDDRLSKLSAAWRG